MDLRLANKRVLITGSSGGIGFGIAQSLRAEGARVVISGRNVEKVRAACDRLGGLPGEVVPFVGDLTVPERMQDALAAVKQAWGGLDVLVLSLGSGRGQPDLAADASEWERVLRLNLVSSAEMLRLATPLLAAGNEAAVVLIGSIAGLESLGAPWPYGAAKAGLMHLANQSARHLAARKIRVNLVAPGNIFFPDGTWDRKLQENRGAVEAMLKMEVPQGRLGTVAEIAAAVAFLASPVSTFTTGACLAVDGGQSRH